MPTINNYTFSDVQFVVPEDSFISDTQQTAVITISPLSGYTATAADFSAASPLPDYVQSVVFTQDSDNVLCTVTFITDAVMPSSNVTIPLCVIGSADIAEITIAGTFTANVGSNVTGDTSGSYSDSGAFGETELMLTKTYTADSGYKLTSTGMQVVVGNQNDYSIEQAPTYDGDGNLTSITYSAYYTYPNESVADDQLAIFQVSAQEIFVKPQYVTNYQFPHSAVSGGGATLIYYVHGQEGATFSLNVTAVNGSNFTPANNVTIPANGIYAVEIDFPDLTGQSYESDNYTLTISGDLEPNFSQPTSVTVVQSVKIPKLTFTATTTSGITGFSDVVISNAAFSDLTKNPKTVEIEWPLTSSDILVALDPDPNDMLTNIAPISFETAAAVSNGSTVTTAQNNDLQVGDKFNLYDYTGRGDLEYEVTAINSATSFEVTPNITVGSGVIVSAWRNNGNSVILENFEIDIDYNTNVATFKANISVDYFSNEDATFTFLLDNILQEIPSITCATQTNNGSAGVTDHMLDLDPAGGLIAFLVNAQSLEDKFEIIHGTPGSNFFVKKATSSMKAADNFGPFENNFGTETANQLPTSTEVNNIDQFIGTSSGTVPTRETEFNLDTDFDIVSMTVGSVTYQQVIWWEYTAADYTANPNASLRVTGPSGTAWNILRLCCPDANCQAFVPSPFGLTAANSNAANACADTSYVNTVYVSYDEFKLGKTVYTDSGLTTGNEFVGDGTSFYGVDDTPEIAIKIDANGVIIDYIHLCI